MTIKIDIRCDNAAFDGRAGEEAARILRDAIGRLEEDPDLSQLVGFPLRDVNGNTVGKLDIWRD